MKITTGTIAMSNIIGMSKKKLQKFKIKLIDVFCYSNIVTENKHASAYKHISS